MTEYNKEEDLIGTFRKELNIDMLLVDNWYNQRLMACLLRFLNEKQEIPKDDLTQLLDQAYESVKSRISTLESGFDAIGELNEGNQEFIATCYKNLDVTQDNFKGVL